VDHPSDTRGLAGFEENRWSTGMCGLRRVRRACLQHTYAIDHGIHVGEVIAPVRLDGASVVEPDSARSEGAPSLAPPHNRNHLVLRGDEAAGDFTADQSSGAGHEDLH
jgi:hypothetical protein